MRLFCVVVLCIFFVAIHAAVVAPPVTGRFPLSFRNPRGTITNPIPNFTWCNDKRQLDGTGSCGDFTSKMRWGNAGFAPASCHPTPGASGWNLKPINDNADGVALLNTNGSPEAIAQLQHINFLIHENPGMAANIHLSINIDGLESLQAQWNIRHDETTNWFLSSSCNSRTYRGCCGASCCTGSACQGTVCGNCMTRFPNFCPYGGSPCDVGCNDAIGFTTDYPLKYTFNNVKKVGSNPNILPNCQYDVSVWWGSMDTSVKEIRGGVKVNGVFITKEGQDNTAPLYISVDTTCQQTCPPCSPCEQCVNFACVPKCNDPCAPCVAGVCKPTTCTSKCQMCDSTSGRCVPKPQIKCNACQTCDPDSGTCARNPGIQCSACEVCDPSNGQCIPDPQKRCSPCEVCDGDTGECVANPQPICDACHICSPADGKCIPNPEINCTACEVCDSTSGRCVPDPQINCTACQTCNPNDGTCVAVNCESECLACNPGSNRCEPNVNATCGNLNSDCMHCDESGSCVSRVDQPCTLEDNDDCRNPYCNEVGECLLGPDQASVGTVCGPTTECMTHVCDSQGACSEAPIEANTSCSLTGIDTQCQTSVCSGSGECVPVALLDGTLCQPPPNEAANRDITLCRSYACQAGKCGSIPLLEGTNCTHRRNESDLEEKICAYSICSRGICVVNSTLPGCIPPKRKGKVGLIVGIVAGVAALVVVGVIAAFFILSRPATPLSAGEGVDYMSMGMLDNPTYNPGSVQSTNPMYNEDS